MMQRVTFLVWSPFLSVPIAALQYDRDHRFPHYSLCIFLHHGPRRQKGALEASPTSPVPTSQETKDSVMRTKHHSTANGGPGRREYDLLRWKHTTCLLNKSWGWKVQQKEYKLSNTVIIVWWQMVTILMEDTVTYRTVKSQRGPPETHVRGQLSFN